MEIEEYYRPSTLEEAIDLFNKYGREARILAGGTDLIVALREKVISCKYMIDIKGIEEMNKITFDEEKGLTIGGAVCLNDIMENKDVKENYPLIIMAGKTLANSLLRNRATLVGNICNSSPAGDMIPACLVLGAEAEAVSKNGVRIIPLKDFFLGVKKNCLTDGEIFVKVHFPIVEGTGSFKKKSRIKGHDLAQIAAAGFLKENGNLLISISSAAPVPLLFEFGEASKETEIIENIALNIHPISDQRSSKEYRLAMAKYLTQEVLKDISMEVQHEA